MTKELRDYKKRELKNTFFIRHGSKNYEKKISTGIYELDAKEFRKEVSKLSSIANKRINRLEQNDFKNSPAYTKWLSDGGEKFGVKGKTFNEVQSELSRLKKFLESTTSTITGVKDTLKQMAENTGVKYESFADLKAKSDVFFKLSSMVEQYLRTVDDIASAIGYQKIWETINQYVKDSKIELDDANINIEELAIRMGQVLADADSGNMDYEEKKSRWVLLK